MSRTATLAAVTALTASLLTATASPAVANGVRCATGQPPNQTQTMFLTRDNLFTDQAFFPEGIWQGDTFRIFADGLINDGGWPSSTNWPPVGKAEAADSNYPMPGANKYSLVAKLRDSAGYSFIGSQSSCTTSNFSARQHLKLTMNDHNLGDNSGSWRVTVQLWWGP